MLASINFFFLQNGDTPLLLASREGHCELVEMLIKSGADTTVVNKVSFRFSNFVTALIRKYT